MKKFICMILAMAMLFTLAACGSQNKPEGNDDPNKEPISDVQRPDEDKQAKSDAERETTISGGWIRNLPEEMEPTEEDIAKVREAFKDYPYELDVFSFVGYQIVNGTNYCYLVDVLQPGEEGEYESEYEALAFFHEALDGTLTPFNIVEDLEADTIVGDFWELCDYGASAYEFAAESDQEQQDKEQDFFNDAWNSLNELGKVNTENGLLFVEIRMPAELCEDETQASIDAGAGEDYISGTLNEDGSVTYRLTKEQHREMLVKITEAIDEGIDEIVSAPDITCRKIDHNDKFTEFDVYLTTNSIGIIENYLAYGLAMYGSLYETFTGAGEKEVVINFYSANGELISSISSADLQ